jgi:hypothetical protein
MRHSEIYNFTAESESDALRSGKSKSEKPARIRITGCANQVLVQQGTQNWATHKQMTLKIRFKNI